MSKVTLRLSIDANLLQRAQAAGVDPAQALEDALADRLGGGMSDQGRAFRPDDPGGDARAAAWAKDNAAAIEDYNRRISERGVFGEEWRRW